MKLTAFYFVKRFLITYLDLTSVPAIMVFSATLSQLISNVPFDSLYLPILANTDVQSLMALPGGSTIAGNFLVFGAANNVIFIQNAEKRGGRKTGFF